jgi:bifunctional DNA-binding transcriptional regulator/antitoxin component of YhaV-PrlF toxin-antitoxin module
MEQIIKVDKAGNFKIPREIKKSLKLKKDDNLLVFSSNDSIIIKRIKSQKLKGRLENLSDKICKKFKTDKISKADLTKAVEWARK